MRLRDVLIGASNLLGMLAAVCSHAPDPFSERCLDALAYRSPDHGSVEWSEQRRTPTGRAVTVRYESEDPDAERRDRYAICEYAAGERWNLRRMVIDGRELQERELALVNSELLLRDLSRHPERFAGDVVERSAPGG